MDATSGDFRVRRFVYVAKNSIRNPQSVRALSVLSAFIYSRISIERISEEIGFQTFAKSIRLYNDDRTHHKREYA